MRIYSDEFVIRVSSSPDAETLIYIHKPVKKMEADGVVTPFSENGANYIKVKTMSGRHKVVIEFIG